MLRDPTLSWPFPEEIRPSRPVDNILALGLESSVHCNEPMDDSCIAPLVSSLLPSPFLVWKTMVLRSLSYVAHQTGPVSILFEGLFGLRKEGPLIVQHFGSLHAIILLFAVKK